MRTKRSTGPPEFDIVSLVDMVFLLLIFGLVVTSLEMGYQASPVMAASKGLSIRIQRLEPDAAISAAIVDDGSRQDTLPPFPVDSLLKRMTDGEFWATAPARILSTRISEFVPRLAATGDTLLVEIEPHTVFRLVGFILTECSGHGDSLQAIRVVTLPETKKVTDASETR